MRFAQCHRLSVFAVTATLFAAPAHAGQMTYNMPVQAQVISGCTIATLPLIFNVPAPVNANVDSTSTLTVACTPNTPFIIEMNYGLHANGINRRVRNAAANAYMRYFIYRNAARSQAWGLGPSRDMVGNSGPTGHVVYTVYGRLQSTTSIAAGSYQDTVTVTITF